MTKQREERILKWRKFLKEVMCVDGDEYVRDLETFEADEIAIDPELFNYGLTLSDVEIVLRLAPIQRKLLGCEG